VTVQPSFVLDSSTLAVIGALIGSLAGAVGFLFRQLIASKDAQMAALFREMESQRAVMMAEIQALKADRDYFRGIVLEQQRRRSG